MLLPLVSCGGDDSDLADSPDTNGLDGPENYEKFRTWYETLKNTSWRLESSYSYYSDGSVEDNTIPTRSSDKALYDKYLSTVMTLTASWDKGSYDLYMSTIPGAGYWWIYDDGTLVIHSGYYTIGSIPAVEYGLFSRFFPGQGKIEQCTTDKLVLSTDYGNGIYHKYTFRRVYGYSPDYGDNSGGNDSDYEKPEIGLEDYTCTATSITAKFRIYNQSEAKVTSAKGYIGTSSPSKAVSATVSGSLITIRFTSLIKGTTYYIKCSATGKGGTTTSETIKLVTNS